MKTTKASNYLSHSGHEFSANEKKPQKRGYIEYNF